MKILEPVNSKPAGFLLEGPVEVTETMTQVYNRPKLIFCRDLKAAKLFFFASFPVFVLAIGYSFHLIASFFFARQDSIYKVRTGQYGSNLYLHIFSQMVTYNGKSFFSSLSCKVLPQM